MKIKFILLIVLFSITMLSVANNKATDSVKVDKSDQVELQYDVRKGRDKTNNSKTMGRENKEISALSLLSRNWLTIVLIFSNLCLLIYVLVSKSKVSRDRSIENRNKDVPQIKKVKTDHTDDNFQQISEMKRKNAELEEIKGTLERRNAQLEQEKEELNNENIELGKNIDDLKFQLNSNPPTELMQTNKVESDAQYIITKCISERDQFYLKESKQKNHTTPYLIFEKDNDLYFKFDETNLSARDNAFNFYNIYMEGYCDGINIRTDAHTSFEIVNNSFGKLKKDGDKYLVVERIKVNYLGGK